MNKLRISKIVNLSKKAYSFVFVSFVCVCVWRSYNASVWWVWSCLTANVSHPALKKKKTSLHVKVANLRTHAYGRRFYTEGWCGHCWEAVSSHTFLFTPFKEVTNENVTSILGNGPKNPLRKTGLCMQPSAHSQTDHPDIALCRYLNAAELRPIKSPARRSGLFLTALIVLMLMLPLKNGSLQKKNTNETSLTKHYKTIFLMKMCVMLRKGITHH